MVPAILANPDESNTLIQWKTAFDIGKVMGPSFAAASALCSFVSAYTHYHAQVPSRAYFFIAAGLMSLSIGPFTVILMKSTNAALLKRVDVARGKTDGGRRTEETARLLGTWSRFNLVRSALSMVGALLAFQAL